MSDVTEVAMQQDALDLAVLLLIKTNTGDWLRLWAGVGPFPIPADDVDTEGGEYQGMGQLVGLPQLSQLINGVAQRVEFTLSGVDAEALRLVDQDAHVLRDAAAYMGITVLDEDLQPVDDIRWFWEGRCDTPRVARTGTGSSATRQISLSIGTWSTGRRRPRRNYWSGIMHRRDHPTDKFFDNINRYSQETTVVWPT